jgi:beta-lactam-binding protein with PASTA domain
MPDLTGLPIVSAQSALSRVGLKFDAPHFQDVQIASIPSVQGPGAIQSAPLPARPTAPPGVVLTQQPAAGSRIEVGSLVTLTVAK